MGRDRRDVRRVERTTQASGLLLCRQPAPAGAASFAATYVAPAGWGHDPDGAEGTARVVAALLASGAGPWDRRALDRELDRLGATLSARAHPESAEVTVWGPAALWDRLLELLAAVVGAPRFASPDLARVRRQLVERQLRERTQPASRAEEELARAVFPPGHPYRLTGLGTEGSVRRLKRRDLVRFHRDHYPAEGALLVVTGGPPLPILARAADRRLAALAGRRPPPPPPVPAVGPPPPAPRRVALPGRAQVELRVGGPSVARSAPNFPGVFLANEVLGGRPLLSRLFQNVRERRGLAYHASSELEAMRWGGYWVAGAGTGPERVEATEQVLRAEIARIADGPLSASELDRIRESAIGELPLALETTRGAHELAVDLGYHGLPDDFLVTWPATLRALRPRDVVAAAADGLDPRRAAWVIAGPPAP